MRLLRSDLTAAFCGRESSAEMSAPSTVVFVPSRVLFDCILSFSNSSKLICGILEEIRSQVYLAESEGAEMTREELKSFM